MMRPEELRPALYHRFHVLVQFIENRHAARLWRTLVWVFWIVYFGFVALVLLLRYSILSNIET